MFDALRSSQRRPAWVDTRSGFRASFPGEISGALQGSLVLGLVVSLFVIGPGAGGLFGVLVPALMQFVRSPGAPTLTLGRHELELTVHGRTRRLARTDVTRAYVRREARWELVIDGVDGPLVVEGTGAGPVQLDWIARVVSGWVQGDRDLPEIRDRVVEEGLGAMTLVYRTPWTAGDLVVASALGALIAGLILFAFVQGPQLWVLAAVPFALILGHLVGARATGRSEVRLGSQGVRVEVTAPKAFRTTFALEDVVGIEPRPDRVQVRLQDGRSVRIPARDGSRALAHALELASRRPLVEERTSDAREAMTRLYSRVRARRHGRE